MDIQIIFGIVLVLLGLFGSLIPALPGPFFSFLGIIIASFSYNVEKVPGSHFLFFGIAFGLLMLADYLGPILGTRLIGSTGRGTLGAFIGAIVGLILFPPLGIFIGAFLGAVAGEYSMGSDPFRALKAGLGVVLGGFFVILLQVVYAITAAVYLAIKIDF